MGDGMFAPQMLTHFSGQKITASEAAYEMVWLFPDKPRTKRRNRRVRGKYGKLKRMNPLAFQTPFGLVVHPLIYAELKRHSPNA